MIPVKIENRKVADYMNSDDIVRDTIQQIMKDFGMFGITISFSGNIQDAYAELHDQLVGQITLLLGSDYGRLLSVLYQVDISDKDIARTEAEIPEYNHVEVLAHQIIVRDLKKVLTRRYFKQIN